MSHSDRKEALKAAAAAEEALYPCIEERPEKNVGKYVLDKLTGYRYKIYGIEAENNLYILSESGGLKLPFDYRKNRYVIE
jgi:hypothetical protein